MSKFVFLLTIAFYVSPSMAAEMYGLFMVVKGDIKIETLDKKITVAKVGTKIKPTEAIISGADSRAKVVMSDRNVINISPNSKLIIEKYDSNPTTGEKNVQMNLLEGKVRNNVEQKYDGDKAKFILKTPTAVAGIRGTEFLTSYNSQTNQTTIVTFKGAVTVSSPSGGAPTIVGRGQSTEVSEGKAPEPAKAIPATELKQIDKESSSTAAPKKEDVPVADSAKPQDKKEEAKKSDSPTSAVDPNTPKAPDADRKDAPKDSTKADTSTDKKADSKRQPSAVSENVPTDKPKMVDTADMNTDMVKALPPPPGQQNVAPPMAPPVTTVLPNKPPDAVKDIVNNRVEKSKISIKIEPSGP